MLCNKKCHPTGMYLVLLSNVHAANYFWDLILSCYFVHFKIKYKFTISPSNRDSSNDSGFKAFELRYRNFVLTLLATISKLCVNRSIFDIETLCSPFELRYRNFVLIFLALISKVKSECYIKSLIVMSAISKWFKYLNLIHFYFLYQNGREREKVIDVGPKI